MRHFRCLVRAPEWTLISAFLVVLQGTLPLVSLCLMKLIVDYVIAGMNPAYKQAASEHLIFFIFLAAGMAFFTTMSRLDSGVSKKPRKP